MNTEITTGVPAAAPVAPAAPAPTTAPESVASSQPASAPSFEPRFTTEDRELLRNGNQETQRLFAEQLTPEEQELILSKGFDAIFKTEAPAAPAAPETPAATPPAENAQATPPDPDAPAWMLTPEEYAGADEKTKALFDALLEAQETVAAQKPVEDPYAKDPVIAWRREALARGDAAIPLAPTFEELGGVDLLRSLEEAFQQEDIKVWVKGMEELIGTVSKETAARANLQNQMAVQEAYQAGAKSAELRSELIGFVKDIPEFKGAAAPIVVRGPEGNYILNQDHPAKDFALWIKDQVAAGTLTDAFVMKHGYGPVWTTYQADKAGGFNKMQAMNRERISKDIVTRMKEVRTGSLSRAAAPSVGAVTTGTQTPAATFHGFTRAQLNTPEGINAALTAWDRSGNKAAMDGVLGWLRGTSQVPAAQR